MHNDHLLSIFLKAVCTYFLYVLDFFISHTQQRAVEALSKGGQPGLDVACEFGVSLHELYLLHFLS
jgi:phosphopantetheinyl transferase